MREGISFLGSLIGVVGGVVVLYAGVLIATVLPGPLVLYGLPVSIIFALVVLGMSLLLYRQVAYVRGKAWRSFAITFSISFVVAAAAWLVLISPYANLL